jgi:hypothetical protein
MPLRGLHCQSSVELPDLLATVGLCVDCEATGVDGSVVGGDGDDGRAAPDKGGLVDSEALDDEAIALLVD